MLRQGALSEKVMILGVDGMDPRFTRRMLREGKMPNTQKLIDAGACREDLMMLGANPTITPPLWATLATGAYPMTHGIYDYAISGEPHKEITINAFSSAFLKAEPIFNVTANEGINTLVFHWPGGSWPPTVDNGHLWTIDGSSPGAVGGWTCRLDFDSVIIASDLTKELKYTFMGAVTSDLKGDEDLPYYNYKNGDKYLGKLSAEGKELLTKYRAEIDAKIGVEGYSNTTEYKIQTDAVAHTQWEVADFPCSCSMSPITEPEGWEFDIPEGSKEFAMKIVYGQVTRYGLILKNAEGKYDRVAIYKDKATSEPLAILEDDVFYEGMKDTIVNQTGVHPASRNLRMLKIAEDGSYVRIWSSPTVLLDDDKIFYPKSLHKELFDLFGPMPPSSQMSGRDADLIMKCNNPQWKLAADWQSKCIHHLIETKDIKAVFSHYHNIDLQTHNYIKYMKNREDSCMDESEVVKFAEATYQTTDEYLGTFLHYLDEGWTIIVTSDHGLNCGEEDCTCILGDIVGVNVDPLRRFGYTVLKKDENGNDIAEIDMSKTTAYQTRSSSIYVNLKGRDPEGIVDPADKWELEERIMTDLYNMKDPKTGKRMVYLAIRNKDAVHLGLGGPGCGDITFFMADDYALGHGSGMSTAEGHNDTSLSPIFIAAGAGIKPGFKTTRVIREVDVAPTVSALLGVPYPAECEGAPVYQILTDKI